MGDNISLKVSLVKNDQTRDKFVSISSTLLNSLASKAKLMTFILKDVFEENVTVDEKYVEDCRLERKSKRHKRFVPLHTSEDFKELMRSLRVKNHVKLAVYLPEVCSTPPLSESPLSEALEQIKKISSGLQKSELWDLFKSMTLKSDPDFHVENKSVESFTRTEEAVVHPRILCDFCHPSDDSEELKGTRYKCTVCQNFDLCEKCYMSRVSIFGHLPTHEMISIPKPSDSFSARLLYLHFTDIQRPADYSRGTKIVESSSTASSSVAEAQEATDLSTEYKELLSLIPDVECNKFDVIKSLIQEKYHYPRNNGDSEREVGAGSVEEKYYENEVEGIEYDSEEDVCGQNIVWRFAKKGDAIHLFMENRSSVPLLKGPITVKHSIEDETIIQLEMESDLLPDEVACFDLSDVDSALLSRHNFTRFWIEGPVFEAKCMKPIYLSHSGIPLIGNEPAEPIISTEALTLEVTVVPKGKLLSQIMLANKSNIPFDARGLTISVVNCLDRVVALVTVKRKHAILPGRIAKFNVPVNNTHFKYPFKILIESEMLSSSCDLSLKQLSGVLRSKVVTESGHEVSHHADKHMVEEHEEEPHSLTEDTDIIEKLTESNLATVAIKEQEDQPNVSHESQLFKGSQHSLIIPSMPLQVKESIPMTEATNSSDHEDYDVISIADGEETQSDYEVLSRTMSFET